MVAVVVTRIGRKEEAFLVVFFYPFSFFLSSLLFSIFVISTSYFFHLFIYFSLILFFYLFPVLFISLSPSSPSLRLFLISSFFLPSLLIVVVMFPYTFVFFFLSFKLLSFFLHSFLFLHLSLLTVSFSSLFLSLPLLLRSDVPSHDDIDNDDRARSRVILFVAKTTRKAIKTVIQL